MAAGHYAAYAATMHILLLLTLLALVAFVIVVFVAKLAFGYILLVAAAAFFIAWLAVRPRTRV